MRYTQFTSLLNGLLLSTNVVAASVSLPTLSPYVDFTLNTHWDSQSKQLEPMDLVSPALNHQIKSYHLAFITDSAVCQPAWGGQQEYLLGTQWGKRQTDLLADKGVKITVSFGGANGTDISHHCNAQQLINAFAQTITTYHVSALDFDIENGSVDVEKLISALRTTQAQHPKIKLSFTLPVMPEGLMPAGKDIITKANQAGLRFNVNIMAMDYGPAYSGDMGDYATQAAFNVQQFLKGVFPEYSPQELWNLIEVTPMIGVNDVNTEQFTLNNADYLQDFARTNHLAGLGIWSLNRDKPCPDIWASNICSGNTLQQKDYEYTEHLNFD